MKKDRKKKRIDKPFVIALVCIFLFIILIITIITVQKQQIINSLADVLNPSVDPTSPTNIQPNGQSSGWHLVFSDEFNENSLDLTKWIMCNPSFQSSCNPYNNEQEIFNTSPNNPNVVVTGGILKLIASKQSGQISSGMVSTGPNVFNYNQPGYQSFQYTYGYYEGRVKIPKGNGFWPSMWELPDQQKYGAWPTSGEYDVFEIPGNDPTQYYFTAHWGGSGGECGHPCSPQQATISDSSATYHTFALDWEPNGLTWYFDGKKMGNTVTDQAAIQSHPFYIIANFSVGGDWGPLNGAPDGSTPFPSEMDIDYLRVWQKGAGTPAATNAPTQKPVPTSITPAFNCLGNCPITPASPTNTIAPTQTPSISVPVTSVTPPIISITVSGVPTQIPIKTPPVRTPNGNPMYFLQLLLQILIALLTMLQHLFHN